MIITVTKPLPVGFMHRDQNIQEFTVRQARVLDTIEAVEEVGADASPARLRVATEARQITFTGIAEEDHTLELVLHLCPQDYDVVGQAIDEVAKKLQARNAP